MDPERYSEPSQISKMESSAVNYFLKSYISDAWLDSEYASAIWLEDNKFPEERFTIDLVQA